jgi:glutathione S-transferase
MTIKVHHLGISQGERILWLLEELNLPYELIKHTRSPLGAPDSLKSIPGNSTGKSPFIEDTSANLTLAESAAICEYIIQTYRDGRLALKPGHKNYAEYLYWFHYANGTALPAMQDAMFVGFVQGEGSEMVKGIADSRVQASHKHIDDRLADNKWLAGEEFTAADVMSVYNYSTQRLWGPQVDLTPYPNIVRWLKDCSERPAYQKAMEKGDPEMELYLGAEPPAFGMFQIGGTDGKEWKKKSLL